MSTDGVISMVEAKRADDRAQVMTLLDIVLKHADELGFVVTVTQEPLRPLAMGNYKTVATVRDKRS